MTSSLIVVANKWVPAAIVNMMLDLHRRHNFTETIVSVLGNIDGDIAADKVIKTGHNGAFNLSKARNVGAKAANGDWLIFSDIDVYYLSPLTSFLHPISLPILGDLKTFRGRFRMDVQSIGDEPLTARYEVGPTPLFITKKLFEEIGGFHEEFTDYGFEDSDFLHKLEDLGIDCPITDSSAMHVLDIHGLFPNDEWHRGDKNREIFNKRLATPVAERINQDLLTWTKPTS